MKLHLLSLILVAASNETISLGEYSILFSIAIFCCIETFCYSLIVYIDICPDSALSTVQNKELIKLRPIFDN